MSSTIFTGSSSYSADFQNVIDRAVAIASLPLNQLTTEKTTLTSQSDELTALNTKFTTLQTAVSGLSDAFSGTAFSAEVSDTDVLTATVGSGASEGNYSVKVTDAGAYATSLTSSSWVNSTGASYSLYLGANRYDVTPSTGTAASLVSAINSKYGSQVRATLVNVGSSSSPDYRISLQSTKLGDTTLDLKKVGSSLQSAVTVEGAEASSQTASTWVAAPGAAHTYQLVIGNNKYDVTPADNSAQSLVDAINAAHSDKVTASLVNLGTELEPDYRIKLASSDTSVSALDIKDAGLSLQASTVTGKLAQYEINNSGATVSSDTRTLTLATGLTVNLKSSNATAVNITVSRSTSSLVSAMESFVTAYNDAVDELDAQRGETGGALSGQSIVTTLSQALSNMATYTGSGTISGLKDLGLELGKDGKLTFSSFSMMAADMADPTAVATFFGAASSTGFLKLATDTMNGVENSTSGVLTTMQDSVKSQISDLTNTIAVKQDQIDTLRTQLEAQMAAADALIASMEQQYSFLSNMLTATQDNLKNG